MKKLALALVCLVSVAFFASCDPTNVENPEPSIAIVTGTDYLYDGQVVEMYTDYNYGFHASSNAETLKELAKMVVTCTIGDEVVTMCDSTISGTDFTFEGMIYFENNRDIVGTATLKAVVTDVAGEINTASLTVSINEDDTLTPTAFMWNRHGGNDGTGLEMFGLKWEKNLSKEIYAVIEPLDGATLYEFDADVWDNITTATEKAAWFSEQTLGVSQFKAISCTVNKTYDPALVIGTVYNGETYLIEITSSEVSSFKGTDVTAYGQYK